VQLFVFYGIHEHSLVSANMDHMKPELWDSLGWFNQDLSE